MSERFKIFAAVYLLLKKDDRVLLMRRCNTGWQDGNYSLASGHIDGEESFTQAIQREAKEELGIDIADADLSFVHAAHRLSNADTREYIDMYFVAEQWQGEPGICEPEKCDDLRWTPINELPSNTAPSVAKVIELIASGIVYSETGF